MALTGSKRFSSGGLLGSKPEDRRLYEQYLANKPAPVQPQDAFSSHYDQLLNSNRDRDPNVLMTGIKALHANGDPQRLPTIDEVESAGRDYLKANEQGYVETIGKGVVRGFQNMAGGINSVLQWGAETGGAGALPIGKLIPEETRTRWAQPFKEGADYWRRAATEGVASPDPEIFKGTFFQNPSFKRAVGIISEAVPTLAAAIVVSAATGSPFLGASMLGALEGAPQYGEAREKGKSIDEANMYGALSTLGTTLLEYLPISRIFKRSGGFFRGATQGAIEEGLQESTQQLWQNIIAKIGYEPTQDLAEGIIESFIGGAGSGGLAGGTVAKLNQSAEKARQGGVTNEEYNALWEDVANQVQNIPYENFKEILEVARQRASTDFGNEALQKASVALEEENRRRFDRGYEQIVDDVAGFDKPLRPLRSGATLLEDAAEARKEVGAQPEPEPAPEPKFEGRWTAGIGTGRNRGIRRGISRSGGQIVEEQGPPPTPEKETVQPQEDVGFVGRWTQGIEAKKTLDERVGMLAQYVKETGQAGRRFTREGEYTGTKSTYEPWFRTIMQKHGVGKQGVLRAVEKGLSGEKLGPRQQVIYSDFRDAAKERHELLDGPDETQQLLDRREAAKKELQGMTDEAVNDVISTLEKGGDETLLALAKDEKAFRETMGEKKSPKKAVEAKEPWQMTKDEWKAQEHDIRFSGNDSYYYRPGQRRVLWTRTRSKNKIIADQHRYEIKSALMEGKSVPADVLAEYPELNKQYSAKQGQPAQVSADDVKSLFKGQDVDAYPDGLFHVHTKSGKFLSIKNVAGIYPDHISFEMDYGRPLRKDEVVAGFYSDNRIEISLYGNKWTLQHETSHWLEDTGILSPMEVSVLRGHIRKLTRQGKFTPENKDMIGGAEDRANFIADQLNKGAEKGPIGRIIGKVKEWIDKFVNLFTRTPAGIVRDIESGKVYERTGKEASGLPFFQGVFHGSPHRFDKFTTDKMGTGEGAQAFGWGLYFAGKKEVANWYREKLLPDADREKSIINDIAQQYIDNNNGDVAGAASEISEDLTKSWSDKKRLRRALKVVESGKPLKITGGQLYEVDIPEDNELLDWDKPLSEQSDYVQKALSEVGDTPGDIQTAIDLVKRQIQEISRGDSTRKKVRLEMEQKRLNELESKKRNAEMLTGEGLYKRLVGTKNIGSPQSASEYLNSIGIKGHRFLDQGSRGKGEGTYNYVIYDDDAIKILKTYYSAQQPQYSVRLKDVQSAVEPFVKGKTLNVKSYFNRTGIQLPTSNPQDLYKNVRRIQTMQDMARNYPNMKRLFDTETKRVSDANQRSVKDKEATDPYFTLGPESRLKINKTLLDGDQRQTVFIDAQLRERGLSPEEIKGYQAIRNILDEKLNILVSQMIGHVLNEDQALTADMVKVVKTSGKNTDKLKKGLSKFGLDGKQVKRMSWIAEWVADRRGYIPHKWDSEWVVRVDLGGTDQWLLEVPTVLGKIRGTRQGRQESANEAAIREIQKKLNLSESKIQALADEGRVNLIKTRELPLELFQGARMDVIGSIIESATDKLHAQYIKDLPEDQRQDFDSLKKVLKKNVEELYLAKGWGRHLIGRKGVKGYREDLENVLSEYLYGFNSFVAKGEAARNFAKVMSDINPAKEPQQWKHGREFVADMLGDSAEAGQFKKIAGLYFLAGDISAAALNMTQNWTHAVPLIKGIKGTMTAERQIAGAMKDVAGEYLDARKSKRKVFTQANKYISQEEIDALRKAYERGLLDPVFLGEVTGFHPNKIWQAYSQKIWDAIFKMFTGAEGWNRTSTFLAAYRRSGNIDKAIEVVQAAHFQYGRGNRPDIIRKTGAIGNIAFTYMTYPMNNLVFLKHRVQDIFDAVHQGDKQARDAAVKVFGSHLAYIFAFGGAMGLPFAWLGSWIWKLFNEPEDDWEAVMHRKLPKKAATLVSRGIPAALLGNDMSWRVQGTDVVGLPIGFQLFGTAKRRGKQAARLWGQGEYLDAIFHLTPDMVRNPYRAVIGFTEGGTRRGVPPIKYTTGEAITRGLGFSPTRESEAYKASELVTEKKRDRDKKLADFAERLMVARQKGRPGDIKELMRDVAEYNRKERSRGVRGVPIPWKTINSSAKKRLKSKQTPYGENIPKYLRGYQRQIKSDIGG